MRHQHILVIRFSDADAVAKVVPVVWAVSQKYPEARITVLSRAFARELFEGLAPNVNFMEADLKGEYRGIKGLNALYRRLAAKQFTHVADLHSVLRSNYLRLRFNLSHFKVAHLKKKRKLRQKLMRKKYKEAQTLTYSVEKYCDVFSHLGFPIDNYMTSSVDANDSGFMNNLPKAIAEKIEIFLNSEENTLPLHSEETKDNSTNL